MRVEIAGAQITDAVADVIDSLQNDSGVADCYLRALDIITRRVILDINADDDAATFNLLRSLQMIRRDIATLAAPPDVDDSANDTAAASL